MFNANSGEYVVENICEAIVLAIAERALRPGMKIHEDVIAQHFNVSRTVARGAVAMLERERIIERQRNHGAFVATPGKDEAINLLEARSAIELAIVERAISTVDSKDLDVLEAITQNEHAIHAGDDTTAQLRMFGDFHLELAARAGNRVLFDTLKNVVARLALVSALYEKRTPDRCGATDHLDIVTAIRAKDRKKARKLMEKHLEGLEAQLDLSAPVDDQTSLSAVLTRFAPLPDKTATKRAAKATDTLSD